jgi:hypothetical protein
MAKATLASQRAEIAELQELLSQRDVRIQELETERDANPVVEQPDSAPRLPNLAVRAWLPKSLDEQITRKDGTTFNSVKQGQNQQGVDWIKFRIQLSHLDERSGKRFYSKSYFQVKAMGAIREQIIDLISSNERLVELTASYLPYEIAASDARPPVQVDEFYLKSVTPVLRKEESQQASQEELEV